MKKNNETFFVLVFRLILRFQKNELFSFYLDNEYDARLWKNTRRLAGIGMPPVYNPRRLQEQPIPIILGNNHEVPNQQRVAQVDEQHVPMDLDIEAAPFGRIEQNPQQVNEQHVPIDLEIGAVPILPFDQNAIHAQEDDAPAPIIINNEANPLQEDVIEEADNNVVPVIEENDFIARIDEQHFPFELVNDAVPINQPDQNPNANPLRGDGIEDADNDVLPLIEEIDIIEIPSDEEDVDAEDKKEPVLPQVKIENRDLAAIDILINGRVNQQKPAAQQESHIGMPGPSTAVVPPNLVPTPIEIAQVELPVDVNSGSAAAVDPIQVYKDEEDFMGTTCPKAIVAKIEPDDFSGGVPFISNVS